MASDEVSCIDDHKIASLIASLLAHMLDEGGPIRPICREGRRWRKRRVMGCKVTVDVGGMKELSLSPLEVSRCLVGLWQTAYADQSIFVMAMMALLPHDEEQRQEHADEP